MWSCDVISSAIYAFWLMSVKIGKACVGGAQARLGMPMQVELDVKQMASKCALRRLKVYIIGTIVMVSNTVR